MVGERDRSLQQDSDQPFGFGDQARPASFRGTELLARVFPQFPFPACLRDRDAEFGGQPFQQGRVAV